MMIRQMRLDVETIARAALQSVDPFRAVQEHIRYDAVNGGILHFGTTPGGLGISHVQRVQIGAFGKASVAMTAAVIDALQATTANIAISGICICKDGHANNNEHVTLLRENHVQIYEASHPIPDERGVEASWKLLDMINNHENMDNDDDDDDAATLKICCISGGGSALFCTPKCSLVDLQTTNQRLLESGWDIRKINTVRKRLEVGKGGGLQAHVALILSDVIGDPLDFIASGPTVSSSSSSSQLEEDLSVLVKELDLPEKVVEILSSTISPEAPTITQPPQSTCRNILVGNNQKAVTAASEQARKLGYIVHELGTEIQGEAAQIGKELVKIASSFYDTNTTATTMPTADTFGKLAWIGGGETTVTLPKHHGLGGRNQESALSAAIAMHDTKVAKSTLVLACIGTDGTDGPTDAAGAIVDQYTVENDLENAQPALLTHNAYPYLKQKKALFMTGPTGTNVADLFIVLRSSPPLS